MPYQTARILVVDDDTAILELVHQALSPSYQVETTEDWVEAVNLLSQQHFDLLLLDLGMPVFDAPEFIKRVHTLPSHSQIPILIISAYPKLQERIADLPVAGILAKPFSIQALLDTVGRLVGSS